MPEAVVDSLEPVEVKEHHREHSVVLLGQARRRANPIEELAAVREARHRVDLGQEPYPFRVKLLLGDVLDCRKDAHGPAGFVTCYLSLLTHDTLFVVLSR